MLLTFPCRARFDIPHKEVEKIFRAHARTLPIDEVGMAKEKAEHMYGLRGAVFDIARSQSSPSYLSRLPQEILHRMSASLCTVSYSTPIHVKISMLPLQDDKRYTLPDGRSVLCSPFTELAMEPLFDFSLASLDSTSGANLTEVIHKPFSQQDIFCCDGSRANGLGNSEHMHCVYLQSSQRCGAEYH